MASKKTIYFTDEMENSLKLLTDKTGMKVGHLIREGLFALLVQNGLKLDAEPVSYFAGKQFAPTSDAMKDVYARLEALETHAGIGSRRKILQDVEDIEKA